MVSPSQYQEPTTGFELRSWIARSTARLLTTGLLNVSYFGGLGDEFGKALALDKYTGEIYVAGQTSSATLAGTANAIQTGSAGNQDAFVVRFDRGLAGIKQSTFLGGANNDFANAMALTDTAVYIAGETGSPFFPGTSIASAQQFQGGPPKDGSVLRQDSAFASPVPNPSPPPRRSRRS